MILETFTKCVYGTDLIYIKDETLRKAITGLTGKKTIDSYDIENLKALGLEVQS